MLRLLFEGLSQQYPGAYEVSQVALNHCFAVTNPKWPVQPTKSFPDRDKECLAPADANGEFTLPGVIDRLRPNLVFALNDPHRLAHLCSRPKKRAYKLVLYLKIDGFPLPTELGRLMSRADLVVTMSDWARDEFISLCPTMPTERICAVYSPADTARFHPLAEDEKREAREAVFPAWLPSNAFVLGWVGRPLWRKQLWLLYKLIHYLRCGAYLVCDRCDGISPLDWDPVEQRHLDGTEQNLESRPGYRFDCCACCGSREVRKAEPLRDMYLWLHSNEDDPQAAWKLSTLEHQFGVRRDVDLYYTEGCRWMQSALAPEDMPTLYQLWDALVYLSGGESFGLPAWEAMCSGLPVVYSDFSSHAEYLNSAQGGLPVGGILQPERKTGIWRMVAALPEAISAVRKLYFHRNFARSLGANGRAFVEQYRVEAQVPKWHRMFESLLASKTLCFRQ
jgi:glycosyltransferase involved in cell wall biosynthesis